MPLGPTTKDRKTAQRIPAAGPRPRHHVHDFIAGGLELLQKLRQRLGGVVLEMDDALAALFQLTYYRLRLAYARKCRCCKGF